MSDLTIQDVGSYVSTNYALPDVGEGQTLDSDDFLTLLITQMQNQDPLEPTDSDQYITQMAQLTSCEQMSKLAEQFQVNAGLQLLSTASSLIGKEVTYTDSVTEEDVTGIVDGVRLNDDNEYVLTIDGEEISLNDVTNITTPQSET